MIKDKEKEKLVLGAYLKEHGKTVIIYAVIIAVFWIIAGLYGYEDAIGNMFYAVILIAFFGVVYGIWDYTVYRKRCMALFSVKEKKDERDYCLPDPGSYLEGLYQGMVSDSEKEKRRMISEFDEKKKDMADYYTMWTHQIKTPIAALRLLLQEDGQSLEELFKIEQYAEMALHYARLDSLSSDLLFKKQDVVKIVKQAVKKYAVLFIGSGLSFTMEEFSCQAVSDEKWLSFVVEQLLSNALKYTPHGKIRIYGLDRQKRETNGNAAFVVIEDSGIGIRGEDLPRVFERGFTGYNGRLDKRSTGIGLYLCKQIFDRLSHTIEIESKAGEGTRVILGFVQEVM